MLPHEVETLELPDKFVYWVRERHDIFIRKEVQKLEPPWTNDTILQTYFFTNPYRENDKVTRWVKANIRDPLDNTPQVVFAIAAFRWFNWIPTGVLFNKHNLLVEWDTQKAIDLLHEQNNTGAKVFTGAFTISPSGSRKPKIERVCEDYIQPIWEDRETIFEELMVCTTLRDGWKVFRDNYQGFGGSGFMAYEITCDFRYTYVLNNSTDVNTWSNPGPGAKRGLNRLLGRPIKARLTNKEYQEKSAKLLKYTNKKLGDRYPTCEMREIEHSLCEFDKYMRALDIAVGRLSAGKMKRKYKYANI